MLTELKNSKRAPMRYLFLLEVGLVVSPKFRKVLYPKRTSNRGSLALLGKPGTSSKSL
jgi:hypothetical protein